MQKGNMETLKITLRSLPVREHSDTRVDKNVDNRPKVALLPRVSTVSSAYSVLIALEQAM